MTAAEIIVNFPELIADHVQAAIVFTARRERQFASPTDALLPDDVRFADQAIDERFQLAHSEPVAPADVYRYELTPADQLVEHRAPDPE